MLTPSSLHVVGLGPGGADLLPPRALAVLESSRVIIGYSRYIDLLPPELLDGRRIVRSGMRQEMERCRVALEAALSGESAALVSSGDPGIYGLSGLVHELAASMGLKPGRPAITVIPGIPALCAAAALLGAPLGHDFASISLSDLLTPWALIEKRIVCALEGDFALVVYNPRSRERDWQLGRLVELAVAARGPAGAGGLVRNAGRPGEEALLFRLGEFDPAVADMLSIVFIGNSQSRFLPDGRGGLDWRSGARLVTPRGYAIDRAGVETA